MKFELPSAEENEAVERLKLKLKDETPELGFTFTDTAILRFYRGRKNLEDKAYNALIRHVEWRKENKVDEIMDNKHLFEKESLSRKITIDGCDKNGRPCVCIHAGRHNKNERDLEQMRMLIIYTLESVLKQTKPEEERLVICFDLSEFSYSCMDYDGLRLLVNILSYNYPETLSVALVVNAPYLFSACWAIIRPWLDPVTAAKAMFIRKDQLTEYFSPEGLPVELK